MSGVYCSNCGKLHESNNKECLFCGHNLEKEILRYKQKRLPVDYEQSLNSSTDEGKEEKATGMEFYKQIKKAEKRRKKYGDLDLKDDLERYNPCIYLGYSTSRRQRECYSRIWNKIPKPLRVAIVLLLLGGLAILIWIIVEVAQNL